ncbi:MAG TPA: proprotein convertase P-domain-containing protein [Bryobacteraceae bacterium]|nr:proprotein convertase P-domain-containing protein [Bryobacteraceae bacterium]
MKNRYIAVLALALTAGGIQGLAQESTVTASYNGYPIAILPDYYDTIAVAFINVPRALKITKVTAKVQIAYPEVGDLNVYLYSPDGTRTKLLEHTCGSLRNVDTTFDDAAPARYSDTCPPEAGRGPFRGNEPLSNFNSADSSIGVWTLAVENNSSDSRAGRLSDVTLTITGTSQSQPYFRPDQVLNSANLRGGAIAPGQVVSIVGSTLGPDVPVLTPAGAWPTSLGDVRVNVNGTDVPIRYASSTRLDVQMPFNLTAGTASIRVTYGSNVSGTVSVPVVTTFPGLFALQSGGTGQAKAANQNGTLNSLVNPAAKGSIISVYGIGLGAVNPAVAAGQVPPTSPLSLATNTIAASIGGVPVPVAFAGLAPGIPGLYQLNIQVTDAVRSGAQEVVISNAGNASQNGLTVQIQ